MLGLSLLLHAIALLLLLASRPTPPKEPAESSLPGVTMVFEPPGTPEGTAPQPSLAAPAQTLPAAPPPEPLPKPPPEPPPAAPALPAAPPPPAAPSVRLPQMALVQPPPSPSTEAVPAWEMPPPLPSPGPAPRPAPPHPAAPRPEPFPAPQKYSFASAAPTAPLRRNGRSSRAIDLTLGPEALNSRGEPPRGNNRAGELVVRGGHVTPDWLQLAREWLEQHGYYPPQAAERGEDGTVTVTVRVGRDGKVRGVEMASRSGSQWLDMATLALFRYAQLPPLPPNSDDQIEVDATIQYILIR